MANRRVIRIKCISETFTPKLLSASEYTCKEPRKGRFHVNSIKGLRFLERLDVKMEKKRTKQTESHIE